MFLPNMEYLKAILIVPIIGLLMPALEKTNDWLIGILSIIGCMAIGTLYAALRDHRRLKLSEKLIAGSVTISLFIQGISRLYVAIQYDPKYFDLITSIGSFCQLSISGAVIYFFYERWKPNLNNRSFWLTVVHGLKKMI